jgi:hypothetical protein
VNTSLKMMVVPLALTFLFSASATAQIYKHVDDKGNVTYTDEAPLDGSAPMVLPELSVIQIDSQPEPSTDSAAAAAEPATDDTAAREPTPRELRRMYRDFRITRPVQEETFWGTQNMVVVSWGSSTPLRDNMRVNLFVDGQQEPNPGSEMVALTLDRGEHQVYAELLDSRGRRVVATPAVTFFVKQYSANFKQPATAPNNGP